MLNKPAFDRHRRDRGISLERLARAAEISVSYATQISHGFVPAPEVRGRVAAALGVSPSVLWTSSDTEAA